MSILEVNNVSKSFGGVKANVDISMSVEKGKIVGLIGWLREKYPERFGEVVDEADRKAQVELKWVS